MKKLIVLLCILMLGVTTSSMGGMGVLGVGGGVSCTKDTGTLVYNNTTSGNAWGLSPPNQAAGQDFQYGSEFRLYSITITFKDASSCVATLRIGAGTDLGTYMEEWASVSIPDNAGDSTYEFVSVDNDTFSASTTYGIGLIEVSGTCSLKYSSSNEIASSDYRYNNSGSTSWDMNYPYPDSYDITAQVNKCE